MNRTEVNDTIIQYLSNYNAERIGIFGSFARGEETDQSDIDILVRFKFTPSLLTLVNAEQELALKLGKKVDLITEGSLKNQIVREKYIPGPYYNL